jgi:hypothetical protein
MLVKRSRDDFVTIFELYSRRRHFCWRQICPQIRVQFLQVARNAMRYQRRVMRDV